MKVGDLVKHNKNGFIGVIVKIEYARGGHDPFHYIRWVDGAKGACWSNEVELVSESR